MSTKSNQASTYTVSDNGDFVHIAELKDKDSLIVNGDDNVVMIGSVSGKKTTVTVSGRGNWIVYSNWDPSSTDVEVDIGRKNNRWLPVDRYNKIIEASFSEMSAEKILSQQITPSRA